MSKKRMGLKVYQQLRENIADKFEAALDSIKDLAPITLSDKREAAERARDTALKVLYDADAIEPPEGINPS